MKCPKCSHDAPKLALRCPKCMSVLPKSDPAAKAPKAAKEAKPPPAFPITPGALAIAGAVIVAVGSLLLLRHQEAKKLALARQQAAAEAAQREEQDRLEKERIRQEEVKRRRLQLEEEERNAAMQGLSPFGPGIPAFPGAKASGSKSPSRPDQGENPPVLPALDPAFNSPEAIKAAREEMDKEYNAAQQQGKE